MKKRRDQIDKGDGFGSDHPHGVPSWHFYGVKEMDYSTAVRADISRQDYTVCPRHWYINATFVCRSCQQDFIWTASEQRFWFETLRFWVDSHPVRCPSCRADVRRSTQLRKEYDALVAQVRGNPNLAAKKRVVEVVAELRELIGSLPEKIESTAAMIAKQLASEE